MVDLARRKELDLNFHQLISLKVNQIIIILYFVFFFVSYLFADESLLRKKKVHLIVF